MKAIFLPVLDIVMGIEEKRWIHYASPCTTASTIMALNKLSQKGIRVEDIKISGYDHSCYIYYYGY